ncbi:MAG TPA: hypothetical protein VFO19_03595, partial [Vicinamibacterales bacterium]|nr:hypothetical protein [Vicinamibacterales bacterium]
MRVRTMPMLMCVCLILCAAKVPASAQVDQKLAASYFVELAEMCGRDDGRLWGVTLCGPMALVDAATRTSSTSEPAPPEPLPAAFGFANTALDWGGRRWSTIVWTMIQRVDAPTRRRLLVHEAFHRVQPQLGLMTGGADNVHLDALDARCWLVLEWRALAAALSAPIGARATALADAAAFRGARHRLSPAAADEERRVLIIEGLAQYTGTVLAHTSREAAIADARLQLERAEKEPTFVSVFAYSTGAAYGLLLDDVSPGWPRR